MEQGVLLISSPNRLITSPRGSLLRDKPANKFHVQEFIPEELLSILNCSGFIAGQNNVYGQRQRRVYSNKLLNKITPVALWNQEKRGTSAVTPVKNKVPGYFIIIATKT